MIKILGKAIAGLTLVLAIICCVDMQPAKAQEGEPVTFQTFYDELEPYGQWIQDPEYGYVWLPDVDQDFKPYATNGHWIATEYGNTWVSDYDWGWAAFHYGRWRFDEYNGWEWIPGTEWAPAWVNWRSGDDYYGWAPLGPGVDIDVSFGAGYYEPDNYWVFAPRRYIYAPNIFRYYVPFGRNVGIIRNTSIISNIYSNNNRRYISGPRPDEIRQYTNAPVTIYNLGNRNRPGSAVIRNNTLNIYRPQIADNRNNGGRPSRVLDPSKSNGRIRNNANGNNTFGNRTQPVNQGNNVTQGSSNPGNTNNGFGRSRGTSNNNNNNNNNPTTVNQFPQRSNTNPINNNNTGNGQNGTNVNGTNSVNPGNRPTVNNQPANSPTIPNANPTNQQGNYGRPSRNFDINRNRTGNQIQQNQTSQNQSQQNQAQQQMQQQQMQQRQQQMQQNQANQQQMQQRQQQEMQQRQQQQQNQANQQQMQQRNQQQMQQRQQQMQQRQQQQNQQQQRAIPQERPARQNPPERQDTPERQNMRG